MKRPGTLLALSLFALMLSAPAFAADPAASGADRQAAFEKRKASALERLDRRIGYLKELRECVAAANNREDMQKCREKFKEEREAESGKRGK